METNWKVCSLADIGTIITGKTPTTKNNSFWHGNVMFVTPGDLQSTKHLFTTERFITKLGLKAVKGSILPKGTICISSIGNLGYVGMTTAECVSNQQINSIIPNKNMDADFIYYLMKSKWKYFKSLEGQSTALSILNKTQFSKIEVTVPSFPVQKKIASILSSIDDKIELNNKMNTNLEEQCEIQFKEYFSSHINAADTPLEELVDIIDNRGKTPQLKNEKTEFPIIDVRALNGLSRVIDYDNCTKYVSEFTYTNFFRSGHPKLNDILLSTVGTLAEMKIVTETYGCIAQNVVALRTKGLSPYYLYQYLKFIKDDLISYNIGSVQPSIKVTHIIKHKIFVPSNQNLIDFISFAETVTNTINANVLENKKLTELRDALLPKLMSGEIDVEDLDI